MTDNDIQLKLLANVPIDIDGMVNFQLPTIREIIMMGEEQYNYYMSALLFSKDSLSDSNDEVLGKMNDYEIFSSLIAYEESFQYSAMSAFSIFTDQEPKLFENGAVYFGELSEDSFLDESKWKQMQKIIRLGNYIPEKKKEEEYKAGNNKAKELIDKIMRKKKELNNGNKDEKINLHSIISAVSWRTSGINDILNLTIYQLYDAYHRLNTVDNYHYTFTGIYSGSISHIIC